MSYSKKENYLKFFVFIAVVAMMGVVYFLFAPSRGIPEIVGADINEREIQEVKGLLSDLRDIRIDRALFESDAFISLKDQRKELPSYALGKDDPFEPLPEGAGYFNEENMPESEEGDGDADDISIIY